jgi:hypothetical protein
MPGCSQRFPQAANIRELSLLDFISSDSSNKSLNDILRATAVMKKSLSHQKKVRLMMPLQASGGGHGLLCMRYASLLESSTRQSTNLVQISTTDSTKLLFEIFIVPKVQSCQTSTDIEVRK